jgi:hypothetical protein
MIRAIICFIAFLLISSCAPKPIVVDVKEDKDLYLNCNQIDSAIITAERYKVAARAEDRFKLRYIFLPTTMLATYRFHVAENAAIKRIKHLKRLSQQRNCNIDAEPIKPRIINQQLLNYPNNQDYPKNHDYSDYNYYSFDGEPQYAPPSKSKIQSQYNENQYINPQEYNEQYNYEFNRQYQNQMDRLP